MPKSRLSDLDVDEISLVYKGANQHSRVAIAKSADGEQEENMDPEEIFDQDGNALDFDELVDGDIVYDEGGNPFQFQESEAEDLYEDEHADVEKAFGGARNFASDLAFGASQRAPRAANAARKVRRGAQNSASFARNMGARGARGAASGASRGASAAAGGARQGARYARSSAGAAGNTIRSGASGVQGFAGAPSNFSRLATAGVGAGGVVAGGAGGYGLGRRDRVGKSFGESFREEFGKALTDDARDEAISKAMDQVEGYVGYLEDVAKSATDLAEEEREIRRDAEYLEIAKQYSLPVADEELAEVFKACEDYLPPEYVEIIAKCFSAASDAMFDEAGVQGGGARSDVMNAIEDYANGAVEKSHGNVASYDAISKAFETNPGLYEQYLEETGYYNR